MSTIRYFIPEDGDSEVHPNVFLAPKSKHSGAPPTLGQVKSAFPLPGRYHFRFKAPLVPGADREKNSVAVWMDCVDERQTIPSWRGTVVAKITRIGVEEDDDDEDDSDFGTRTSTPAPAPPAHQQQQQQQARPPAPAPAPMLDIFDGPAPPQATHSAPASNNLFDSAPHSGGGPASLLDMANPSTAYSGANDFLGMTAAPPATPQQQQQHGYPGATPGYPPQQQQAPRSGGFDSFANQHSRAQEPFGGLGTPWK